jgi:hypothetical protein
MHVGAQTMHPCVENGHVVRVSVQGGSCLMYYTALPGDILFLQG